MAHARADIIIRWPALGKLPDSPEWTAAIADAELQVHAPTWGARNDLGVIHLAAHALMLAHPEVVDSGPVQSESVGGVSRTYAVSSTINPSELERTPAGREFKRQRAAVRQSLGLSAMVV
jgi:hypothetical protein